MAAGTAGLFDLGNARQVVLVQGEDARDALAKTTGRVVAWWQVGTQGLKHADWLPLANRNVVIWPDADSQSVAAADEIAEIVAGLDATVRVMRIAIDGRGAKPVGWNAAAAVNEGMTKTDLDDFMRATVRPWVPANRVAKPAVASADDHLPEMSPHPIFEDKPLESSSAGKNQRKVDSDGMPNGRGHKGPVIAVVKGYIHKAVDGAMLVLSDPALEIYSRGDDLVRAVTYRTQSRTLTAGKQGENIARPDGAVFITTLTEASLIEILTRNADFVKYDGRADKFVSCDCPTEVARIILANKGHGWMVPRLRSVISAPTLRHDGSVIDAAGYDPASGLLLVGDRLWRKVSDNPSRRMAVAALDVLSEPIDALPFVATSDRAAALALLITSVMRPTLRTSPMFAVTAPAAGTGKSLTIDIASIMATGRKAAVVTPTPDEAELEKRIGATALAGDQIISIDNVTHILRSDQLCQMLTQDEVQVRVLGASKNVRIPSTSLICTTGNNLSIYGDLNRRTIRIRLDAKCERPDERSFAFDATGLALRKRSELVAAALTIVRAYMSAGTPNPAPPMGSFEDWSDTVRSALIWLGMGDCRGDIDAVRAEDPEKAELAEIIASLPEGRFTSREVGNLVAANAVLRDTLERFIGRGGAFSTRTFGKYLARYAHTVVGGRWIEQASNDAVHGVVWQIGGSSEAKW